MRQIEPTIIRKGERIEWEREFGDFPSDEWTLQYRFRGAGPGLDVNATAGPGTGFTAEIPAVDSALPDVGKYQWQAWVTNIADTTIKQVVASGFVTFKPGFVSGETGDIELRSTAKQIVDALEAALLSSASREQMEYEIETPAGRRRVKYMSRTEQKEWLQYYKKIVARENAAERVRNGGKFGTQVKIRMREQ